MSGTVTFDLRGLDQRDIADLKDQLCALTRFTDRLNASIVLRATETERSLTALEAVGHLSSDRLWDLDHASTRLLQILALDGLVFGERPLKALTDEGLLQRLGEVLRVVAEKGASGLHIDGRPEGFDGASGVPAHGAGVRLDGGLQQPGHEDPPQVHDVGKILPVDGDGVLVPGAHVEPLVPRRATPPP